MPKVVEVDTIRIRGWETSHGVFDELLGFPGFYGRIVDAWIDRLTSLDEPDDGLTTVHPARGGMLVLSVTDVTHFASRCPEIYDALVECTAFVNYRNFDVGESPVFALSYWKKTSNKPLHRTSLRLAVDRQSR